MREAKPRKAPVQSEGFFRLQHPPTRAVQFVRTPRTRSVHPFPKVAQQFSSADQVRNCRYAVCILQEQLQILFTDVRPEFWRVPIRILHDPLRPSRTKVVPPEETLARISHAFQPSATFWGCLVADGNRSEEHTSELQSLRHLVCRLLL